MACTARARLRRGIPLSGVAELEPVGSRGERQQGRVTRVQWPGLRLDAHVRPSTIIVACGDGNLVLAHMRWTRWGGRTASGHGTALYNTCSPDCAHGHFAHTAVEATLSRPAYCGSEGRYAYRTLVVDVAGQGRQRAPFSYLCHE